MRHQHARPLAALLAIALLALTSTASAQKRQSFRDTIQKSDLVIVGAVVKIDEKAGTPIEDPMTRLDIAVEHVLRGDGAKVGEVFPVVHRGGYHSPGLREVFPDLPIFTLGDRYVLCLRAGYNVSPFVSGPDAVMRVVSVGGADALVDSSGRLVGVSDAMGLMKGSAVAQSIRERANTAARGEHHLREVAADARRADAADVEKVFSFVEEVSAAAPLKNRFTADERPMPRSELGQDQRPTDKAIDSNKDAGQ